MQAPPEMRTAPARGRRADTSGFVGGTTKPDLAAGTATVNLRDLRSLTAKLDALCVRKEDIERRLRAAERMLDAGCLFPIEIDDLADAVAAWRMAAADVVLGLSNPELTTDLERGATA